MLKNDIGGFDKRDDLI